MKKNIEAINRKAWKTIEGQAKFDHNAAVLVAWRNAGKLTPEYREAQIAAWKKRAGIA